MSNDEVNEPVVADSGEQSGEQGEDLQLETYDLNHDGKISPLEGVRATLGLVDARLEEIAEQADHKGVKGHVADAAHKVVDKLDND